MITVSHKKTYITFAKFIKKRLILQEGVDRVKRGNYAFLMESTMLDYVSNVYKKEEENLISYDGTRST